MIMSIRTRMLTNTCHRNRFFCNPSATHLSQSRQSPRPSSSPQELLLILEEFWERNAELRNSKIPIYYASQLAKKCMKA
jgi:hypothetical protein